MRALVAGHHIPLSRDDVPPCAKSLYNAAMARGPVVIAEIARDVTVRVTSDASSYSNLVGTAGKRKRKKSAEASDLVADPLDEKEHRRFRYTIYREIETRLGYHGAGFAVPLPVIAEQIVKIALPGPREELHTGFKASAGTE